jgi:CMP-N-acetylneuraminic acid synthetase
VAAQRSGLFSEIVVSTEDAEIARIAETTGATVDVRPASLTQDSIGLAQVIDDFLSRRAVVAGHCCILIANCPLRSEDDIRGAYRRICETEAHSTISVVRYDWRRPQWALRTEGPWLRATWAKTPSPLEHPESLFCPTGAVRWIDVAAFRREPESYPQRLSAYELPWWRGIDIDEKADLEMAECVAHAIDHGFCFAGMQ